MSNTATKPQSSMSNAQLQTRGLSAGDWVRLKRLNGAKTYKTVNLDTNKDINPTPFPQIAYGPPIEVYKVVGTSKIRRTASNWIDYKASQTADYPAVVGYSGGTAQRTTKLCSCESTYLSTKTGICTKCVVPTHVRIM